MNVNRVVVMNRDEEEEAFSRLPTKKIIQPSSISLPTKQEAALSFSDESSEVGSMNDI